MADPIMGRIESLLATDLSIPQDKIRPEADLRHDLGLDSFAAVELVFALEEAFAIKISEEEIAEVKTVGDLAAAVRQKVQGDAPPAPAQP